jgi:hypothetical protein
MKTFILGSAIAILALSLISCISIPIPPTGSNPGSLGKINIQVTYSPASDSSLSSMFGVAQPKPKSVTQK